MFVSKWRHTCSDTFIFLTTKRIALGTTLSFLPNNTQEEFTATNNQALGILLEKSISFSGITKRHVLGTCSGKRKFPWTSAQTNPHISTRHFKMSRQKPAGPARVVRPFSACQLHPLKDFVHRISFKAIPCWEVRGFPLRNNSVNFQSGENCLKVHFEFVYTCSRKTVSSLFSPSFHFCEQDWLWPSSSVSRLTLEETPTPVPFKFVIGPRKDPWNVN